MHDTDDNFDDDERPSRSARRREALDTLALARQLADLTPARLDRLQLPDDICAALATVQRTPSHIARKRELAHLAKLMRAHDATDFAPARAELGNDRAAAARDAAALHHVESLRDGLLDDATGATLTAFIAAHPGLDHQRLHALIRQARRERDAAKPPRAQRELFRLLRDVDTDRA